MWKKANPTMIGYFLTKLVGLVAAGASLTAASAYNLACGAEEPPPNATVTIVMLDRYPNGVIVHVDGGVGWWSIDLNCYSWTGVIIWHESFPHQYDWRWGPKDIGVYCPDSHPFLYRGNPAVPPYIGPYNWK
jgi:hypothetical protein